jgi:hypothetical protein
VGPVDGTIRAIYHRNRQHIWAEFSVERAEIALEKAGLFERTQEMPAICFVDITGFTRLTEERATSRRLGSRPHSQLS